NGCRRSCAGAAGGITAIPRKFCHRKDAQAPAVNHIVIQSFHMLKVFNEFPRNGELLRRFEKVATCFSASCVFADVQYRTGVMASAIKPPFPAKVVGQALTVQLSRGDLVDPLKALEMGQPGDVIVVDAGGETATS